jgi:hypothetical protein
MGLGEMFGAWIVCPFCRKRGAKKTLGFIKCANPQCPKYDPQLIPPSNVMVPPRKIKTFSGNFDPGANTISIQYRNYLGEERVYDVDKTTLHTKREHISACVVPTGKRIAFNKKFIKNLKAIEDSLNSIIAKEMESQVEIKIRYINFKGQEKIISVDANTAKAQGEKISIKAIPSGKTFWLKKRNIQNFSEIEKYIKA